MGAMSIQKPVIKTVFEVKWRFYDGLGGWSEALHVKTYSKQSAIDAAITRWGFRDAYGSSASALLDKQISCTEVKGEL